MYFKNIILRNVGPIENINYDFPFSNDGNPKPLILVGTNGSGKSILLSYLLNPLIAAQQVAFDNPEVESGKVYKLRSPQFGNPEIDSSFEIPLHETSIFNPHFINKPLEVSKQFENNCVLYFPAIRFEQPA